MSVRPIQLIRWFIAIVGGALLGVWILVQVTSRTPVLQQALIQALNDRLDADVELQSFRVRTFPVVRIEGHGLRLRAKGQQSDRPFIEVRDFEVVGGLFGMLHRQRRFGRVQLHGLRITIPPRTPNDRDVGNRAAASVGGPVIIDEVVADDAELVIVPKDLAKEPRVFSIHHLRLESVGFKRSMPFTAQLTNPTPTGEITTTGEFGPWVVGSPGTSPVSGRYTFNHADLSTITGIGGTLDSVGDFGGELDRIDVTGTTTTPDFSLDSGGQPTPLDTRFHVVVDGTSGNTFLKEVHATLQNTAIDATGEVTRQPGVKGRTVKIDVRIQEGQLQDVLRLAVHAPRPVMVGRIALQSAMLLPPGDGRVIDRLQLNGRFVLEDTRFTDKDVQTQLAMLSRRSQGKKADDPIPPIRSNMRGRFVMKGGGITFESLAFDVPGAEVHLAGRYGLRSETLDFQGTLSMSASVSQAAGGIKGFFLKPFDPLFHKNGKGAVIPITISGPRAKPKFGLNWGGVFK